MGLRPVSLSRDLFLGGLKCTQSPHPMTCVPALLGSFSRGAAAQREGDRWLQQMSSLKLCLESGLLALRAGMLITKGLGGGVLLDTQTLP